MKALKVVGLAVLGFALFVSLSFFGLAFTLNSTLLNPRFIPGQVDRLDISALADEILGQEDRADLSQDVREAFVSAVDSLEPDIKTQLREASSRIYEYLLGRADEIDLTAVLKDTVLGPEFIDSVIDEAGITALARESLRDELVDLIPPNLTLLDRLLLARYLDETLPRLDPWIREQVDLAAGPVVDYLLGESPTLNVVVDLGPMKTILRTSLREAFLRSPPPGVPPAQLDDLFTQVYNQYAALIPATATIDETTIGFDPSVSISRSLADAEAFLTDGRAAVSAFRAYYVLAIVLVVLLIAGIVLVHREVKGAARDLGIIFLVYGATEWVGIIIARYSIRLAVGSADMPETMRAWLPGLVTGVFRPLEILSLTLALVGIALIVISLVYRRTPTPPRVVGLDQQS